MVEIMERLKSAAYCPNLSERVIWSTIPNVYVLVSDQVIYWHSKMSALFSKKTTHGHWLIEILGICAS